MAATPSDLKFTFPSGMTVKLAHMEHEKNKFDWQGSAICYMGWDEITHFTRSQFFYMLSRNRSMSGVRPYIRGTCNPDPDSWVRQMIDWWIGEDGFPIKSRIGVIRWFNVVNDEVIWSDKKVNDDSKSFTFIPSKLSDNKILMQKDPGYLANLNALPYVQRMQLLEGNWNVKPAAGLFFKRQNFEIVDALPTSKIIASVRYWDRAASKKPGADFTVGLRMHKTKDGVYYISNVIRFQGSPLEVRSAVKNAAAQDGITNLIGIEQDPGQAGVVEADEYIRMLAGYMVKLNKVSTNKEVRAGPLSAQCEAGNVKLVKGGWNETFLLELESFPESTKDDQVDAASGAFHLLTDGAGQFTRDYARAAKSKLVRNEDYD